MTKIFDYNFFFFFQVAMYIDLEMSKTCISFLEFLEISTWKLIGNG